MNATAQTRPGSLRRATMAMLAVCLTAGCTTVEVVGAKPPRRLWALGAIRLEADPASSPIMVMASRGFGIVPGPDGVTLGYRAETRAVISNPEDCRVVFFAAPADLVRDPLARTLAAQLKEGELCVVTSSARPPSRR